MIAKPDSPLVAALCPSPNFGERRGAGTAGPTMLIMHYTGMKSCNKAIEWLADPTSNVSCHYVVAEDGVITQMVGERQRAWHAGQGFWQGETDINSTSIGIEIHNLGYDLGNPEFPEAQMAAVEELAADIVQRWKIAPQLVLGHSDVAPQRKGDPGEKFDWARLAKRGVGLWVEPEPLDPGDAGLGPFANPPSARDDTVVSARVLLAALGYEVEQDAPFDKHLQKTVLAFQRHFRQARCDGRIDGSTLRTMHKLVEALPQDPTA